MSAPWALISPLCTHESQEPTWGHWRRKINVFPQGDEAPVAPGTPKDNAAPQGEPPLAPTCLLRVQGDARDGGVAGGFQDLPGDTGHYRTEQGL